MTPERFAEIVARSEEAEPIPGAASWSDGIADRRDLLALLRETAGWIADTFGYPFDVVTTVRPPAPLFDLIVRAHWQAEVDRITTGGLDLPLPTLEEFREACEIEADWTPGGAS